MRRMPVWPAGIAAAAWIAAEILRAATTGTALLGVGDALAAASAGPRAWPVLLAWGPGSQAARAEVGTRQQWPDGCGAAALLEVLRRHGRPVRHRLLYRLTRLPAGGTTAHRLAHIGRSFGVDCSVQRLAFPTGETLPLPAILHLRRGHFVVLRQWGVRWARLFDPACGGVLVRHEVLRRRASGIAVVCGTTPGARAQAHSGPNPRAAGARP